MQERVLDRRRGRRRSQVSSRTHVEETTAEQSVLAAMYAQVEAGLHTASWPVRKVFPTATAFTLDVAECLDPYYRRDDRISFWRP